MLKYHWNHWVFYRNLSMYQATFCQLWQYFTFQWLVCSQRLIECKTRLAGTLSSFCYHSLIFSVVIIFLETINSSQNTTPLNLDAIPSGETQSAKSSEQEVINMLLAQHGIIPVSNSLDVPTFSVQASPTFNATNLVSEKNSSSESDSKVRALFFYFQLHA